MKRSGSPSPKDSKDSPKKPKVSSPTKPKKKKNEKDIEKQIAVSKLVCTLMVKENDSEPNYHITRPPLVSFLKVLLDTSSISAIVDLHKIGKERRMRGHNGRVRGRLLSLKDKLSESDISTFQKALDELKIKFNLNREEITSAFYKLKNDSFQVGEGAVNKPGSPDKKGTKKKESKKTAKSKYELSSINNKLLLMRVDASFKGGAAAVAEQFGKYGEITSIQCFTRHVEVQFKQPASARDAMKSSIL